MLVGIAPVTSVLMGVAVLQSERLVRVLVAELELTPPAKLLLLRFCKDVAVCQGAVPCYLGNVVAEVGLRVGECSIRQR